jgi:GGDEF domain-containing protein
VRSIGISIYPAAGSDARTSLKRADEGMYLAKSQRAWGAVFAA